MDESATETVDELVLALATATPGALDEVINGVLARLGSWLGADRVHVVRYELTTERMFNTHEWCAPGVSSHRADIQNIPFSAFPWSVDRLRNGHISHLDASQPTPEAARPELISFGRFGMRSVIQVPLMVNARTMGNLGFTASHSLAPTPGQIEALRTICSVLGTRLVLAHRIETLSAERDRTRRELDHISAWLRTAAHEFRTPLQSIFGLSALLDPDDPVTQQLVRIADELKLVTDRLLVEVTASAGTEAATSVFRPSDLVSRLPSVEVTVDDDRPAQGDEAAIHLFLRQAIEDGAGPLRIEHIPPARIRLSLELPDEHPLVLDPQKEPYRRLADLIRQQGGHLRRVSEAGGTSLRLDIDVAATDASPVLALGLAPEELVLLGTSLRRLLGIELETLAPEQSDAPDPDTIVLARSVDLAELTARGVERGQVVLIGHDVPEPLRPAAVAETLTRRWANRAARRT